MSVPRIILASLPSFCQKLSKFVEIWRSSGKNNFSKFFLRHGVDDMSGNCPQHPVVFMEVQGVHPEENEVWFDTTPNSVSITCRPITTSCSWVKWVSWHVIANHSRNVCNAKQTASGTQQKLLPDTVCTHLDDAENNTMSMWKISQVKAVLKLFKSDKIWQSHYQKCTWWNSKHTICNSNNTNTKIKNHLQ